MVGIGLQRAAKGKFRQQKKFFPLFILSVGRVVWGKGFSLV